MRVLGRPVQAVLVALALLGAAVPALAQDDQVPQSLWGVRGDVGLGLVPQFVTNYGDRGALEDRPSGEDVRVAVIDTGLAPEHPDLDGALACPHCWHDFVDNRTRPYDDNGHGTHVAGIIAGNGHFQLNPLNSYFPTGAIGMASDAKLVVAKAMNETGRGEDQRVARAIEWAIDPDGQPDTGDEPHVLHLSLGITQERPASETCDPLDPDRRSSEVEKAVTEAVERGIHVVMSAGNHGCDRSAVPGNVDGVIAVGALSSGGHPLEMSNRGEDVDVFAPGVVMSAWPHQLDEDRIRDGYTGLAGTSQAAPVVTGGLALAIEANPQLREGGATKVEHVETMAHETGERRTTAAGPVVAFDGEAFLSSQDQGTDDYHWGMLALVTLLGLLVVFTLGRIGFTLVQEHSEAEDERPAPPGERSDVETGDNVEFSSLSDDAQA